MTKQAIRKRMLEERNNLSEKDILEYSAKIVQKIYERKDYQEAKVVALFYPLKGEISLLSLLNEKKEFVFPKTSGRKMEFLKNDGNFKEGPFHVMVPSRNEVVQKEAIDLIIVPLLAFDEEGYRVGYGKGFYDSYLKNYTGKKIGVAYPFQKVNLIETDSNDVPLDEVIIIC